MTGRQLLLGASVLAILVLLAALLLPRRTETAGASEPSGGSLAGSPAAAKLIVRVDGEEVSDPALISSTPLSHLPLSSITPSMISQVRSRGNFRTLVLADGSEVPLDQRSTEQLPAETQYRLEYDRGKP